VGLIELLILILILGWFFGFSVGGVGSLIHLILVIAVLLFLFRLFSTGFYGRRGGPRAGL